MTVPIAILQMRQGARLAASTSWLRVQAGGYIWVDTPVAAALGNLEPMLLQRSILSPRRARLRVRVERGPFLQGYFGLRLSTQIDWVGLTYRVGMHFHH
tara:strand:- start:4798 stop:5094 length:297 start_codon:yes stop_codon:yes gene_type:complete